MTKIERPFLAANGFNTNLVHFLPLYHVIISNMDDLPHAWTCT